MMHASFTAILVAQSVWDSPKNELSVGPTLLWPSRYAGLFRHPGQVVTQVVADGGTKVRWTTSSS